MSDSKQLNRRYPSELRARGVRMVLEEFERSGERHGVVTRIAAQLGVGTESLRKWVKQAEVDDGRRPGATTSEQERIATLEREVRELRRANEILKAASAFLPPYTSMSSTAVCPFIVTPRLWAPVSLPAPDHLDAGSNATADRKRTMCRAPSSGFRRAIDRRTA